MTTKTEIGQCKDCRWWVPAYYSSDNEPPAIGQCHSTWFPESPENTPADFGCIHFEQKEK